MIEVRGVLVIDDEQKKNEFYSAFEFCELVNRRRGGMEWDSNNGGKEEEGNEMK
jgi:hypothetical protein